MNLWYDLFLILLLLGGIAAGFALGLFRQLVNIGGLIFAFIFASYYQPTVARLARQYMGEEEGFGRDALLFFLVFLVIWVAINLGMHFGFRTPPKFLPGALDRLAGMIVGLVSGSIMLVIFTLLLSYATSVPWPHNDELRLTINEGIAAASIPDILLSYFPLITRMLEPLLPRGLPPFFRDFFLK